jgi:lipopolysaccharide transport system ATP-binding protein
MHMRLAFAVAAHLETEILLVDELLAVGDLAFQKKCLGKMGKVAREGRTVLFVTHSMAAVNRLCRRGMWLHEGRTHMTGSVDEVVAAYLSMTAGKDVERQWSDANQAPGNEKIRLRSVRICRPDGSVTGAIPNESAFWIMIEYDILVDLPPMRIVVKVMTVDGITVFLTRDNYKNREETESRRVGRYVSRCYVPGDLLNAGNYTLTVSAEVPFKALLFVEEDVLSLRIERTGGVGGQYAEPWPGVVCPPLCWDVSRTEASRDDLFSPVPATRPLI